MNLLKRFINIDPLLFLSVTVSLSILRMVLPFMNYFFLPVLFLFLVFTSVHFRNSNMEVFIKRFLKYNNQLLLNLFFVFLGFTISSTYFLFSAKEVMYAIVILIFGFGLFLFVNNLKQLSELGKILSLQFMYLSFLISVAGLIKYYLQLKSVDIPAIQIFGTSLIRDYNFYILFSFIGIISIFYSLIYLKGQVHNMRSGTYSFFSSYSFN